MWKLFGIGDTVEQDEAYVAQSLRESSKTIHFCAYDRCQLVEREEPDPLKELISLRAFLFHVANVGRPKEFHDVDDSQFDSFVGNLDDMIDILQKEDPASYKLIVGNN